MANLPDRMIRAAKLDVSLYEEVEADKGAMGQATAVVVLSSVAAGVGAFAHVGVGGIVIATIAALVVLSTLNLPVALAGLLISVEPLIDMGRTAINVSGSMTAGAVGAVLAQPFEPRPVSRVALGVAPVVCRPGDARQWGPALPGRAHLPKLPGPHRSTYRPAAGVSEVQHHAPRRGPYKRHRCRTAPGRCDSRTTTHPAAGQGAHPGRPRRPSACP